MAVRFAEGIAHGFLVLRTLDGRPLADGDLIQVASGRRVTSRLTFRFRDGSMHDERAVYTQGRHFRLVSSYLHQKGPAFPRPIEMSIDCEKGLVVVKYEDDDGRRETEEDTIDLPPDLANGMMLTLLKNLPQDAPDTTVSMIAATPKPRLVKLAVTRAGRKRFTTGGMTRTAVHYVVKVEIGGLTGLVARFLGRQPPDSHVWILAGEAPAFVRSEQPFYAGGPLWRIELASPQWTSD